MFGNVFILGDSYSTFTGYIPEGFGAYYGNSGPAYTVNNSGNEFIKERDVHKVEQTWWYSLVNENGKLIRNCSWSGTTICNTGYNGSDNSKISFIARFEKLLEEGFFKENKIDTFLLFGGTNDSWSNAPLGEEMFSGWSKEDLYCVLPAFSYLIDILTKNLPDTKIYCIMNTELKEEIYSFYEKTCKKYGIDFITLSDIDKVSGHPTIEGMKAIKEQVYNYIQKR